MTLHKFVKPSMFVDTVIEMDKDFSPEWIEEMIVSRIPPNKFKHMTWELEPFISSNEMNAAKYAIMIMDKYAL